MQTRARARLRSNNGLFVSPDVVYLAGVLVSLIIKDGVAMIWIIEKDDFGYYAYCPELKGCQTQGKTFEEALANIKEAVELYLETLP